MPRTLNRKLVGALFLLVTVTSAIYIALTLTATRLYFQEVNQKLNETLAGNIVSETPLLRSGALDRAAFEDLFHTLMVVNPSIELYLVGPTGEILFHDAPPDRVLRNKVSVQPIRDFVTGDKGFPIQGDDPRNPQGRKVFSAAEVRDGDQLIGYLYVVLGGEAFDSVAQMIGDSYVLRLTVAAGLASVALALIAGFLSFNWLTRRLRRLSVAVDAFKRSEFKTAIDLGRWRRRSGGDEIDTLGVTVEKMSRHIVDQFRELREVDSDRREMIANISHDLRTPLTSLQGYLETLLIKEHALSKRERRRYLQRAVRHGERMSKLIAELFELAMLDSGDVELQFEPFALTELIQDVSQEFELEAERRGIILETTIPAHAPFVIGDIALIERVLENLIENAIKHAPDGGRVRISLLPGSDRVAARVSDNGAGIPEPEIPKIFERAYRVEKSRGTGPEGTGLGLSIASRILELHGGLITVQSAPGAGASFSFDLPIAA